MRPVWVGAISFGLVNIPVELITAEKNSSLDFTLLDGRDNNPISYRKVNSVTGKQVPQKNIIKAYEWEDGKFIEVTGEDFKSADVEATHTVDIQSFVRREELDLRYFEKPYYIRPQKSGQKAYILLREALKKTSTVAIAMVVMRTRAYLSVIYDLEDLLVLNLLRFESEIREYEDLTIPQVKLSAKENELAVKLVEELTDTWQPEQYLDEYRDALLATILAKAKGKKLRKAPEVPAKPEGDVIDIVDLLRRSVNKEEKDVKNEPKRVRKKA